MGSKIKVKFSQQDQCYIATQKGTDIIGCGDTEEEALFHFQNHIQDEKETPRKKNIKEEK